MDVQAGTGSGGGACRWRRGGASAVLAWVAAALLAGCGGDRAEPPPPSASAVIGTAGGTLEGPGGLRLAVPAGALAVDTEIRITQSRDGAPAGDPPEVERGHAVYEITPHGLQFDAPVTLSMPAPAGSDASAAPTVYMAEPGEGWHRLSAARRGDRVEWSVFGFSWVLSPFIGCNPDPTDPYTCVQQQMAYEFHLTPGDALLGTGSGVDAAVFRVVKPASGFIRYSFSGTRDCGGARALVTGVATVGGRRVRKVLIDQPVTLQPDPDSPFRSKGQVDVPVSFEDGDNGSQVWTFEFSCRRPKWSTPGRDAAGMQFLIDMPAAPPAAPAFTTPPADQTVAAGFGASFSVAVSGSPVPTLQWQRSDNGGAGWTDLPGATGRTHDTPPATAADDGSLWRVVARNASGTATSNAATLHVRAAAGPSPRDRIALGDGHACALRADGAVSCWGGNADGQLGNGGTQPSSVPVPVPGLSGVTAVVAGRWSFAAGASRVCALHHGGQLACWGGGDATPQAVAGVSGAVAVAVGASHRCVLDAQGGVACWGGNASGELGRGNVGGAAATLQPVQDHGVALADVVEIGAGDNWTCALRSNHGVVCWGGLPTGTAEPNPVPVDGVTSAEHLHVGPTHACAVVAGGGLQCWGRNGGGQLGDGSTVDSPMTAVDVTGFTGAVMAAPGRGHTCALRGNGEVLCWGEGPLGNGYSSLQSPGLPVTGLTAAVAVGVGNGSSCALRANGEAQCWGSNSAGELGSGGTTSRATAAPTAGGAVFWHP